MLSLSIYHPIPDYQNFIKCVVYFRYIGKKFSNNGISMLQTDTKLNACIIVRNFSQA